MNLCERQQHALLILENPICWACMLSPHYHRSGLLPTVAVHSLTPLKLHKTLPCASSQFVPNDPGGSDYHHCVDLRYSATCTYAPKLQLTWAPAALCHWASTNQAPRSTQRSQRTRRACCSMQMMRGRRSVSARPAAICAQYVSHSVRSLVVHCQCECQPAAESSQLPLLISPPTRSCCPCSASVLLLAPAEWHISAAKRQMNTAMQKSHGDSISIPVLLKALLLGDLHVTATSAVIGAHTPYNHTADELRATITPLCKFMPKAAALQWQ